MNRFKVGQKFGNLSFICELTQRSPDKHLVCLWGCDCGKTQEIIASRVVNGYTRSCGCLINSPETRPKTHGMKGTPTYVSWQAMLRRSLRPKDKDFPRWGGRGITTCERWLKFENFFADMGIRPVGTTLDRIDGSKGYFPGNCRWATFKVQARNRIDFTIIDSPLGRIPLVDYAEIIGISRGAAHSRLKRGKLKGCVRV